MRRLFSILCVTLSTLAAAQGSGLMPSVDVPVAPPTAPPPTPATAPTSVPTTREMAKGALSSADAILTTRKSVTEALSGRVVSQSAPTAFAARDLSPSEFEVVWLGEQPSGVEARLLPKVVEWVRIDEVLVVPRGRLQIEVSGVSGGIVRYAGFVHAIGFPADGGGGGRGSVAVPVTLLGGEGNTATVLLSDGRAGTLRLRRRQGSVPDAERVHLDTSCSPFLLDVEQPKGDGRDWMSVGCRHVFTEGDDGRTHDLELSVVWDVEGDVTLGGVPVEDAPLRLRVAPGSRLYRFDAGDRSLTLHTRLSASAPFGFIGAGLGASGYETRVGGGALAYRATPFVTMYGSYRLGEGNRLVAHMGVSTVNARAGAYFNYESLLLLDRRVSVNILIGLHLLSLPGEGLAFRVTAPQGVEAIVRDVGFRNFNVLAGGFGLPEILTGKSFVSAYLRYGTPSLFGEINYIGFTERRFDGQELNVRSIGFVVGMPLVRFL